MQCNDSVRQLCKRAVPVHGCPQSIIGLHNSYKDEVDISDVSNENTEDKMSKTKKLV